MIYIKFDFCIFEPETFNGYKDTDGCPDAITDGQFLDADGDGIADKFDTCPNEAETFNRFADYDAEAQ